MKVAVMGAGGIGGYVGGRLAEAGAEVTLIARGAHLEALQRDGLTIRTPDGETKPEGVRAFATPAEVGPVDIILFTVKLADAENAAAALPPMIGAQTRVVTLQNGVDSQSILERHIGPGRVAAGIIYLAANIECPGVIWYAGGFHRTVVHDMDGDPVMARLFAMNDDLTNLDILPDGNPRQLIWGKFVNLLAFSGASSITRSPAGRILDTPEALEFLRALSRESILVARAEGLDFPDDQPERMIDILRGEPGSMKSSMLIDLEAGKPIEMPWLNGRIVELAERHGIDVPANRAVVAALAPHVNGAPAG